MEDGPTGGLYVLFLNLNSDYVFIKNSPVSFSIKM